MKSQSESPLERSETLVGAQQTPLDLAAALRAGNCPEDYEFDRYLPSEILRIVSGQHWTPLAIVARASKWLDELDIRTVVDIGSGAGKFCVAAALCGQRRLIGVEQRASLVTASRTLAEVFDVQDRVTFVCADIGQSDIPQADAYYLYNPFGENMFEALDHLDGNVDLGEERYQRDVSAVEAMLKRAPEGTSVLTYNGFGGTIPSNYRTVHIDLDVPGGLKLWCKRKR